MVAITQYLLNYVLLIYLTLIILDTNAKELPDLSLKCSSCAEGNCYCMDSKLCNSTYDTAKTERWSATYMVVKCPNTRECCSISGNDEEEEQDFHALSIVRKFCKSRLTGCLHVNDGYFPWMIPIFNISGSFVCGAVLINGQAAIVDASCVNQNNHRDGKYLRVGETELMLDDDSGKIQQVTQLEDDITIIVFYTLFKNNHNLPVIPIAHQRKHGQDYQCCLYIEWKRSNPPEFQVHNMEINNIKHNSPYIHATFKRTSSKCNKVSSGGSLICVDKYNLVLLGITADSNISPSRQLTFTNIYKTRNLINNFLIDMVYWPPILP